MPMGKRTDGVARWDGAKWGTKLIRLHEVKAKREAKSVRFVPRPSA